jgi:hypothetical protein
VTPTKLRTAAVIVVAYVLGIIFGNLLWTPMFGILALPFSVGGIAVASPLLIAALLATLLKPVAIQRRPALWSASAAIVGVAIYALFDWPSDQAGLQRFALAATCAACSAVIFTSLSHIRRTTA